MIVKEKRPKLNPLYCDQCEKLLAWTVLNSETYCPKCRTWTWQEGPGADIKKAVNKCPDYVLFANMSRGRTWIKLYWQAALTEA